MKYSILAVMIPALLVSGMTSAAEVYNKDGNKLDLYGKIDGLHYFADDDGYASDGDQSYARLGFKGETQINDQLTGYGQWEYQFQANNTEGGADAQSGNKTRLGFAGLKFANYGSFDYGRNYGVVYDALGWTDMLPEFGGETAYTDNFMVGRATGVATYRNNNFFGLVDGLNFALQYQGKNDRTDDMRRSNGDGYGGSISYMSPIGVGIVGAYASSDRTDNQKTADYGKGDRAEQWATSLKYDANNIYVAATYGETRNATYFDGTLLNGASAEGFANKTQDMLLVAQYQFDFGLRPSIGYTKSKAKDVEGIGDVDLLNYYEVGATYFFNKNMSTYVDYIINQIDDNNRLGINSGDVVALGVVYQF
ncbi:porin OmpF [Acerihabitans sp. TG2]|uniref:porin OmpF n=1 Tax=Acerihabitans sp. TG2 TaxID=3096008 RepID=UPI002B226ABF|nr:porin OmpF [Acerihabitans sp. TG2]MEA9391622.1 porin OmpF [Acerihabitans sp. TG2]